MKLIFLGKAALTKHNFALGYSTNEMNLHCTANDSKVKNRRARHLLVVRFCVKKARTIAITNAFFLELIKTQLR